MLAGGSLGDSKFPLISGILTIGDKKSLSLRHLLIEKALSVGDEEAVAVGALPEDSPADEGMLSVGFDVLLDDDGLVSKLLHAEVVEVARVDESGIVALIVGLGLANESLDDCHQFIGRAVRCDLSDEILEGNVAGVAEVEFGVGVEPEEGLFLHIHHQSIWDEEPRWLLGTR